MAVRSKAVRFGSGVEFRKMDRFEQESTVVKKKVTMWGESWVEGEEGGGCENRDGKKSDSDKNKSGT